MSSEIIPPDQLTINNCGSPIIDCKSDDKITNSSLSSIHNYIKMLSNQNTNNQPYINTNTNVINNNKEDYEFGKKSTKRLGTIELCLSKKKLTIPSNTKDLYKPNELINNPYISRTLLKKMNEIIIENSHSIKQFKQKIVEKNNVIKQEESRAQTELKKNQILTLLDKGSELQVTHSVKKIPSMTIPTVPNTKKPSVMKKVNHMKQMLNSNITTNTNGNLNTIGNTHSNKKRTTEPLLTHQNIVIKINLNTNDNTSNTNIATLPNNNKQPSNHLLTISSSKDVRRRKREEEKNDLDLFKSQLSKPRESSVSIRNFDPQIYMRNRNRKKPNSLLSKEE